MEKLERLVIPETKNTPYIDFNPETGHLVIKGVSIAENPAPFYDKLYQWLESYLKNPKPKTVAHFFLYFFNTSSAMRLLEIFKKLKRLYTANKEVVIRWYMFKNDDDMQEAGEDYQAILELPFEFIEVQDKDVDLLQIA